MNAAQVGCCVLLNGIRASDSSPRFPLHRDDDYVS